MGISVARRACERRDGLVLASPGESIAGNDPRMATLEVTLMGPHLRFEEYGAFAVTGAEFRLTLDDLPVEMDRVIEAAPGAVLKFGARVSGARAYVAVAGGVDVPEVLGSRSTHVLTTMGGHQGRALRRATACRQGVGRAFDTASRIKNPPDPFSRLPGGARLRVIPVDEQLFAHVAPHRFRVSPQSDRMGYRLEGAAIGAVTR